MAFAGAEFVDFRGPREEEVWEIKIKRGNAKLRKGSCDIQAVLQLPSTADSKTWNCLN